ncbi:sulfite exporter TauE/SafE family protein [Massilia sp. W12]|uniref:sulfite exporter TauE/SafE family protein n=1 Tax=Massilia sp. W12 TaxID=3126507 RepID=UPI0030CFF592
MDLNLILVLMLMGAFGGFFAGLLGIGGGMLLVPFITMILSAKGFPKEYIVHTAIATSLATVMFTSLSSVRAHHKHGAVRWDIVRSMTPGILLGSWLGPLAGKHMNTLPLSFCFSAFVMVSATQMLLGKKPEGHRQLPGAGGMNGMGVMIGSLAGLVGAGGGFMSVPFMTWCNVRIHNAVATSAALGFPLAFAGTLSNIWNGWSIPHLPQYSLGFIYLPALFGIAIASISFAPLGAKVAHSLPVASLKKAFAIVLYCLGAYMLWKAWHL